MQPSGPDYLTVFLLTIVALVSGVVSILRRIERGQVVSMVWVVSEFLAAILSAYLAYDIYQANAAMFPSWATLPLVVAVAAHMGGRALQGIENAVYARFSKFIPSRRDEDLDK